MDHKPFRGRDGELEKINISIKNSTVSATVYKALTDVAAKNVKNQYLRRWWCDKYKLPPTDDRLSRYTTEELMIEYLEDAIEDERIDLGVDGTPTDLIEVNGEKIHKTGIDLFDEDEERWAMQKPMEKLIAEKEALQNLEEGENILDKLRDGEFFDEA